jgi:hypothetical protein
MFICMHSSLQQTGSELISRMQIYVKDKVTILLNNLIQSFRHCDFILRARKTTILTTVHASVILCNNVNTRI